LTALGGMAGGDGFRLGELLVELTLEIAQAGEILVEARLVLGADLGLEALVSSITLDSTLLRTMTADWA
jgi:hypothetical protein